jgi:hypothetical protein
MCEVFYRTAGPILHNYSRGASRFDCIQWTGLLEEWIAFLTEHRCNATKNMCGIEFEFWKPSPLSQGRCLTSSLQNELPPGGRSSSAGPPIIDAPPPLNITLPPPLPSTSNQKSGLGHLFAMLLSLFVVLFLADGVISLADDSLIVFFDVHALTWLRGFVAPFVLLISAIVYVLMGLTPMIPKRLFVPLALFSPVAGLAALPLSIYFFHRLQQIGWAISFWQVALGLGILYKIHGGYTFRWPIVTEEQLHARRFSWRNLLLFLSVNIFVLLPIVAVYLGICANRAVDHFSDGFMALRPEGLIVQARKYTRNDGKTIRLFPMAHVGESDFYRKVSQSFPPDATILVEGVSDNWRLLTNRITYERMATSLGVAEQQKEFIPRGKMVRADVDVQDFRQETIDFLNAVMLVHGKGVNAQTLPLLMRYSEPSNLQNQLFDDLIGKRNRHLLREIESQLAHSDDLIVPWGAAHMPEIAREIQKSGFHVAETRDYVAIRFRGRGSKSAADKNDSGKSR